MLPTHVSWANWDKLYLDKSIWEAPVRQVLSDLGFSVRSIEAGFPGTGAVFKARCSPLYPLTRRGATTDRQVFQAQGGNLDSVRSSQEQPACTLAEQDNLSLIVKFFPPMVHRDFVAEQSVYRALSPDPPLPVPRLLATGTLHDAIDWPYLVLEESCGIAVRDLRDKLNAGDLVDIAEQVGIHLRALHSTDRGRVPELNRSVSEWKAWAKSRLEAVPEELARLAAPDAKPLLPVSVLSELTSFLQSKGCEVVTSMDEEDLFLIHADVTEDHVLVLPESSQESLRYRVEAIFDFGDAEVAPVYYEWVPVWFSLLRQDRGAFAALLEQYRGDSGVRPGHWSNRFSERDILLTFTFIHRFSAAIVKETLSRENVPPGELSSIGDLADVLWPL
ncbi:MAG: aminoglycoside phosphotransferase family protein [Firmicutes bacterium]|jgi:Ser/Thr protein kinase RdoA (MazF antagonist)|nr:aminoglycoside phosphotransferase family protein [Candidatus Fermentithermobacillaceae bacterium]